MTVLFGDGVPELFQDLPQPVQQRATKLIDLLRSFPRMYPLRRRGVMKGYHYFAVDRYLFYYSVSSTQIRISAIIPAQMRQA